MQVQVGEQELIRPIWSMTAGMVREFMIDQDKLLGEMTFSYSRSSGPGGQNVNKVNSKATATWFVMSSELLNSEQRARFLSRFSSRLRADWAIVIAADEFRDRTQNQSACVDRLLGLIQEIWAAPKMRKKTRPSRSAVKKRLASKKHNSEKKKARGESY